MTKDLKEKTFFEKMLSVQRDLKPIIKDSDNPFFKSKYADINAVLAEIRPLLIREGLFLTQAINIVLLQRMLMMLLYILLIIWWNTYHMCGCIDVTIVVIVAITPLYYYECAKTKVWHKILKFPILNYEKNRIVKTNTAS